MFLLYAVNRVLLSYEPTATNVAETRPAVEPLDEAGLGDGAARKFVRDLGYRNGPLGGDLAGRGVLLVTERSGQHGQVRRMQIALTSLKRILCDPVWPRS